MKYFFRFFFFRFFFGNVLIVLLDSLRNSLVLLVFSVRFGSTPTERSQAVYTCFYYVSFCLPSRAMWVFRACMVKVTFKLEVFPFLVDVFFLVLGFQRMHCAVDFSGLRSCLVSFNLCFSKDIYILFTKIKTQFQY